LTSKGSFWKGEALEETTRHPNTGVDIGICNNDQNVYILLSWIEGKSLDEKMTSISDKKQYNIGIEAGRIQKNFFSFCSKWTRRLGTENVNKVEMLLRVKSEFMLESCPAPPKSAPGPDC